MERNRLLTVIEQKTGFTKEDIGKTIDAFHEDAKNSTGKTNRKKLADKLSKKLNIESQKIDRIIMCYLKLIVES